MKNAGEKVDKRVKRAQAERLKKERELERAAILKERDKQRAELKKERDKQSAESKARRAELKKERDKQKAERLSVKEKLRAESLKRRKELYSRIRKKLANIPAGFDGANYGIIPRVELEICGDITSVASRFAADGIVFTDMHTKAGKTRLKIRRKDFRKGIAILDEMCYNYQIGATYGIKRSFAFMLSRVGLVLGGAASVALLYIAYGYVWRVDISGNSNISTAYIASALEDGGYKPRQKKSAVDTDGVVATLGGIDGVADASCEVVGTTMYVRVLEATDYTARTDYFAFVSDFDAKVTRIVTRSGSATVKRGDVVKKGDVLVGGDVIGTTGEVLYTVPCDAEVYGEVSVSFAADISPAYIEYVPTGNTAVKTVFGLFGFTLGKSAAPFDSYTVRAHTVSYDVLLPLYVTTYEYAETIATEVERDIDKAATEFAEQKQEEMHFVGEFESSYTVTPTAGGLYSVHVFLSGETLISRGVGQQ